MPRFQTRRRVRHAPELMFDLVADVERYPEFVPLCQALVVRSRTQDAAGHETIIATMTVAYKVFRESFTSRVILRREALAIDVSYLDGPFRFLENRWGFVAQPGGSDVEFDLAYEFRSRALALLMGAVFDRVYRQFADAFEARANRLYPRSAISSS